ncbi:MAG: carbamoyl-phosphate synthase large subunit [Armatimonadota bacterium]
MLWGWCVMPNHVHVVVQPLPNYPLSQIIHSWKSYTAHQFTKRKVARAPVWERDYFQRLIRNQQEFELALIYTLLNPEWTLLRHRIGSFVGSSFAVRRRYAQDVSVDEPDTHSVGGDADEQSRSRDADATKIGVPADELARVQITLREDVQRGWWDADECSLRKGVPDWLMSWFVGGTPTLRGETFVGEDADATNPAVVGEDADATDSTVVGGAPTLRGDADATIGLLRRAKEWQFPDKFLAQITGLSEAQVRAARKALGILPAFKMVDTCAGEFEAQTPYFYSTYHGEHDRLTPPHPRKVLVLGSGPIRIGQGIEFDYSAVHAVKTLRELGYYAIILNNNPETVSTDFDISDALYFDPVTLEDVLNVLEYEGGINFPLSPEEDAATIPVLVQFGGQTAINLVKSLQAFGVSMPGTPPESIDIAEDRRRFDALLEQLGIPRPPGCAVLTLEEALRTAQAIGYPVLVRPSYVLGGRAMEIVRSDAELETYWRSAVMAFPGAPVLVDKYLEGKEAEVDLIGDGERFLIPAIMEHIERAGVHSGDSMTVVPPQTLSESEQAQIIDYALCLAQALKVCGLINVQFVIANCEDEGGKVFVIEANPRASRTVPYLSKVTGVPMVKLAVAAQMGVPLRASIPALGEPGKAVWIGEKPSRVAVKAPVFSSLKLKRVEVALGPEMRSTGEVMGIDRTYAAALYKAMVAAGIHIPRKGRVLLTLADKDKAEGVALAQAFHARGFKLYATYGTARALQKAGLPVQIVPKIGQGKPDLLDYLVNRRIQLLINTVSPDRKAEQQGLVIRRAAVEYGIPCLTALDTAWALLQAMEARQFEVQPIA